MQFHVVSLPHTQLTDDFSLCAYTMKVKNFARMMMSRGHEVVVYGGEVPLEGVTRYVPCFTEKSRLAMLGSKHYVDGGFTAPDSYWQAFYTVVKHSIGKRIQPGDFICHIVGHKALSILEAFPDNPNVEFGIGYSGCFAPYKVFESYAWMHANYGAWAKDAMSADGKWFDAVIHGYYDPTQFMSRGAAREELLRQSEENPAIEIFKDSLVFLGRPVPRKGSSVAIQVAKAAGLKLVIAGQNDKTKKERRLAAQDGIYYVGPIGPHERAVLLGVCRALIAPTAYVEPFGNAVIESMAAGTPVITTDWGAFTETVQQGLTGFRCHVLKDFVLATERVKELDSAYIKNYAERNFSMPVIAEKYEEYFTRVSTLYGGKGWDELS